MHSSQGGHLLLGWPLAFSALGFAPSHGLPGLFPSSCDSGKRMSWHSRDLYSYCEGKPGLEQTLA